MAHLTHKAIESFRPASRDLWIADDAFPGLVLRIKPSGVRSFVLRYRNARGAQRKLRLGQYGQISLDAARKLARQRLAEVANGADPAEDRRQKRAKGASVAEFATRYLEQYARPKKRASSVATDERLLEKLIKPALGALAIADLTRADVDRFHRSLAETPTQANRALALLSKICSLAERWGFRPDNSNPCRNIERFKEQKREVFLSPQEIAKLAGAIAALEADGNIPRAAGDAARMLLFTGCRRSEITRLRWEHVDAGRACLRLPDSKTGARVIKLNAPALKLLAAIKQSSEWVFPTAEGDGPISLSKPWSRIRQKAEMPALRVHDLRHTAASLLVAQNFSLPVIGAILGHRVSATTARYAHLADDPVRAASEKLGSIVQRAIKPKRARGTVIALDSRRPQPA